jgi:hypothetical protein
MRPGDDIGNGSHFTSPHRYGGTRQATIGTPNLQQECKGSARASPPPAVGAWLPTAMDRHGADETGKRVVYQYPDQQIVGDARRPRVARGTPSPCGPAERRAISGITPLLWALLPVQQAEPMTDLAAAVSHAA